jgi:Protein of unknown function (DUF2721)
MSAASPTPNVVHVIQLAVAPVFLLSGVGVILTVLTNRLARIIDRARLLEDRLHGESDDRRAQMHAEMDLLSHRARMLNFALTLSTSCALLVCLVIAMLFVGSALRLDMEAVISVMFVTAMIALIGSLSIFLREIFLGTAQLRIGRRR